jgi:threonylcarbamoyladenosine tRNA methylthiotransferase MtaB
VVVNTCSVTASADQGARQTIRRVARANPGAKIVVTGCYATRRPDELAALPNVVRVVRNDDKPRLIPLVHLPETGDGPCGAAIEPGVAGRTAFTLRVQTGCAEPCSYCIIPATRGAPRSVPVDDVLREVERVTAAGFKEVALTGVHLGSYGRDLESPSSLIDLLRALDGFDASGATLSGSPSSILFRISSLEPMDCSTEIVDLVARSERFAPHFHLPLQHASNRVLAAMRRPYTIAQYSTLVDENPRNDARRLHRTPTSSSASRRKQTKTSKSLPRISAGAADAPPCVPVFGPPRNGGVGDAAKVPGTVVRERGAPRSRARTAADRALPTSRRSGRPTGVDAGGWLAGGDGNYLKVRIPRGAPQRNGCASG